MAPKYRLWLDDINFIRSVIWSLTTNATILALASPRFILIFHCRNFAFCANTSHPSLIKLSVITWMMNSDFDLNYPTCRHDDKINLRIYVLIKFRPQRRVQLIRELICWMRYSWRCRRMGPSMDALANTAIIGKPSNGRGVGGGGESRQVLSCTCWTNSRTARTKTNNGTFRVHHIAPSTPYQPYALSPHRPLRPPSHSAWLSLVIMVSDMSKMFIPNYRYTTKL